MGWGSPELCAGSRNHNHGVVWIGRTLKSIQFLPWTGTSSPDQVAPAEHVLGCTSSCSVLVRGMHSPLEIVPDLSWISIQSLPAFFL